MKKKAAKTRGGTREGAGRKRGPIPQLPIYDSIAACSAHSGIPKHILSKAKHSGCNGFRAGRIYLAEILNFLFADTGGDSIDWDRRFKKARAEQAEFDLQASKDKMATREHFGQLLFNLGGKVKTIIVSANLPAEQTAQICRIMQDLANDFPRGGGLEQ